MIRFFLIRPMGVIRGDKNKLIMVLHFEMFIVSVNTRLTGVKNVIYILCELCSDLILSGRVKYEFFVRIFTCQIFHKSKIHLCYFSIFLLVPLTELSL